MRAPLQGASSPFLPYSRTRRARAAPASRWFAERRTPQDAPKTTQKAPKTHPWSPRCPQDAQNASKMVQDGHPDARKRPKDPPRPLWDLEKSKNSIGKISISRVHAFSAPKRSWSHLGCFQRASWVHLGSFWAPLRASWAPLKASWTPLGASLGRLGASWAPFGTSWDVWGALRGPQ